MEFECYHLFRLSSSQVILGMKMCSFVLWGVLSVVGVERVGAESLVTNRTVLPVPPDLAIQPGNATDSSLQVESSYQQLLRGSSLSSVWTTPVRITGIAFRVEEHAIAGFAAVIPKVEIRLSTTGRSLERMSQSWDVNKGGDEKIVYQHDNVSLFGAAAEPFSPFDLRFELDEPFLYDPKAGNLAMLFVTSGSASSGAREIDASFFGAMNTPSMAFRQDFAAPTPYGLVSEFSWVAVPEPKTWWLVCGGAALLRIGGGLRGQAKGRS
jgi:hypothetical protein